MTFTWIPFYKELAQKLLQYRDNRKPLIDWVYANLQGYIGHLKDGPDGRRVSDVDPFTIFAILNRGLIDKKRGLICQKLKKGLGLASPIPEDYNGIPIVNAMKSNFMAFEDSRQEGDIERLWNVFEAAVTDEPVKEAYDALKGQFLIKINLTIGLFWIRPDKYLPLDGNCRSYLKELGIVVPKDQFVVYDDYIRIMDALDGLIASNQYDFSNYAEFSYIAFVRKEENRKMKKNNLVVNAATSVRYWLLAPGVNASNWDRCQKDGIACIGWDEIGDLSKYDSLDAMREAMKAQYGGTSSSYRNDGLATWEFCNEMKPGDIIYAKRGRKHIIGRGIVESDYIFDDSRDKYKHIRKVRWTEIGDWEMQEFHATKTLTEITDYRDYVKRLDIMVDGGVVPDEQGNYFWLCANPSVWSMSDWSVGEEQFYTLYNDNGNKCRIFRNFTDAKVGDKVICYEASPTRQITALAIVSKENDGQRIWFEKKESLITPIPYTTIKENADLQKMEFLANPNGSFFKLTKEEYGVIMDLIRESNKGASHEVSYEKYSREDFLDEVFMSKNDLIGLENLLKNKKNIILQGAPGVGKTFCARRLAYEMMGEKDESRVQLVQFHQNYSYEDFILGYKPSGSNFELQRGTFYKFCISAANNPDKPYFFIIDEINRGNLSKIFGELLMLIEKDYRGEKLTLAYKDEKFFVPKNVYIIGMMNTADRSLAMIDYALRRRFSFYDMRPGFESDGFKKYQAALANPRFDRLIEKIEELNRAIAMDESLGAGFELGHSYFCGQKSVDDAWLHQVINYDIVPMLQEYWFDNRSEVKKWEAELNAIFND